MNAVGLVARWLGALFVLVAVTGSPALAWPESLEFTVRRQQTTAILKMTLFGDFCQRQYIGKIGVRPDPRLGQLIFLEGEELRPALGCKTAKIPYTAILYKAGPAAGDDRFNLYVSDGAYLQSIKVTVHVR